MYGLKRDQLVMLDMKDYNKKGLKYLEEFIHILYFAGYLEVYNIPKIGEECYFWNGNDKFKSMVGGGPFFAKYGGRDEHSDKFLAEGSNVVFNYCQLVSDEKKKGR